MPHTISSQKVNDYMKEICKLAEINEPINDQRKEFIERKTILGKEENDEDNRGPLGLLQLVLEQQ